MTVSLRKVINEDQTRLHRWRNLPSISRWMYTDHEITKSEHSTWFAAMVDDETRNYWVVLQEEQPVGVVHLNNISPGVAEWGIYIAEASAIGTGAGSGAAFLSLDHALGVRGLEKVRCEAIATNVQALSMYERVGFRRERLLRSHVRRGSEWLDVVTLGLLSQDWSTLRTGIGQSLSASGIIEGIASG